MPVHASQGSADSKLQEGVSSSSCFGDEDALWLALVIAPSFDRIKASSSSSVKGSAAKCSVPSHILFAISLKISATGFSSFWVSSSTVTLAFSARAKISSRGILAKTGSLTASANL